MEKQRPEQDNERRRRRTQAKNKERTIVHSVPRRTLALPPPPPATASARPPPPSPSPANQVKLAALAVDLNVRLRSADMSASMQERVIRHARALLNSNSSDKKKPNPSHLAMCLKKGFDELYGPAWHCIVGKSFGSFVTHSTGGFVYFSMDKFSFLLFKTEVKPVVVNKSPPLLLNFNTKA